MALFVWSLTKDYSTDSTHYPWSVCTVAYSKSHKYGQAFIHATGWREAKFVIVPCLTVLPQKEASDGFEPTTTSSAVHRL